MARNAPPCTTLCTTLRSFTVTLSKDFGDFHKAEQATSSPLGKISRLDLDQWALPTGPGLFFRSRSYTLRAIIVRNAELPRLGTLS